MRCVSLESEKKCPLSISNSVRVKRPNVGKNKRAFRRDKRTVATGCPKHAGACNAGFHCIPHGLVFVCPYIRVNVLNTRLILRTRKDAKKGKQLICGSLKIQNNLSLTLVWPWTPTLNLTLTINLTRKPKLNQQITWRITHGHTRIMDLIWPCVFPQIV